MGAAAGAWCVDGHRRHASNCADLALEGEYRVATLDGDVICHPAFELYARLCRNYPPEEVEAICWIAVLRSSGPRA